MCMFSRVCVRVCVCVCVRVCDLIFAVQKLSFFSQKDT